MQTLGVPHEVVRYLRERWPTVRVVVRRLRGKWGETVWDEDDHPTIYFSPGLDEVQLRCALAHEMWHVEHGPPSVDDCEVNERRVRIDTARWLLPDVITVANVTAQYDFSEAARRLRVVPHVLLDRIGHLSPAERAEYIQLTPMLDD